MTSKSAIAVKALQADDRHGFAVSKQQPQWEAEVIDPESKFVLAHVQGRRNETLIRSFIAQRTSCNPLSKICTSPLFDKHNELDQKIKNMESHIEPGTPVEIETLKKEKLALKDQIYHHLVSLKKA